MKNIYVFSFIFITLFSAISSAHAYTDEFGHTNDRNTFRIKKFSIYPVIENPGKLSYRR